MAFACDGADACRVLVATALGVFRLARDDIVRCDSTTDLNAAILFAMNPLQYAEEAAAHVPLFHIRPAVSGMCGGIDGGRSGGGAEKGREGDITSKGESGEGQAADDTREAEFCSRTKKEAPQSDSVPGLGSSSGGTDMASHDATFIEIILEELQLIPRGRLNALRQVCGVKRHVDPQPDLLVRCFGASKGGT